MPTKATSATPRLSKRQMILMRKALSDPRRLGILERIAGQHSMGCSALLEAVPITAATMSHHLKELEAAGLIEAHREGKFVTDYIPPRRVEFLPVKTQPVLNFKKMRILPLDRTSIRRLSNCQIDCSTEQGVIMSKLAGKVAVVTGASKGIGASIAEHLAAEGASVVVNYASSKAGADKVVNAITAKGGKAIAVQADVSSEADIKRLFAETKKAYGKLDILVNNAGIYEFLPLENITAEHFHKQYNLNVLGLLLTTQEAVKYIGAEGGSIINIGSVAGDNPVATGSVYSSTKAAVDAITIALSKELGARKIRVNSVNPGMVETEGFHTAGIAESDFRKMVEAQTPLGRIGQPEDIGRVAAFIASDDAGWVNGQAIQIAGGMR